MTFHRPPHVHRCLSDAGNVRTESVKALCPRLGNCETLSHYGSVRDDPTPDLFQRCVSDQSKEKYIAASSLNETPAGRCRAIVMEPPATFAIALT